MLKQQCGANNGRGTKHTLAHNAPALSCTTWTNTGDNRLCSTASMNMAHLWRIPMSYGWLQISGILVSYGWASGRVFHHAILVAHRGIVIKHGSTGEPDYNYSRDVAAVY